MSESKTDKESGQESASSKQPETLEKVEGFWDDNVCGSHFIEDEFEPDEVRSEEFFEEYRKFRYAKEHHLNRIMNWESAKGKDVLEIGLGLGADATCWARHAKSFTGVDLTSEAVKATRQHFQILGLNGNIQQGNAENLPFDQDTFDLISSHGVLHHTDNIHAAMAEVFRILKPGGEFVVMLYAKNSFNYWIRIQFLQRIALLFNVVKRKCGGKPRDPWKSHLENWDQQPGYFSWKEWPHHCTDGPDCKIANIYSWGQMKKILRAPGFEIIRRKKAHFPVGLPAGLEQSLASLLGFYQFAWCKKPEN